jgi:hypothetical protein
MNCRNFFRTVLVATTALASLPSSSAFATGKLKSAGFNGLIMSKASESAPPPRKPPPTRARTGGFGRR